MDPVRCSTCGQNEPTSDPDFLRQIDYRSDDNPDDSFVPNYVHNTALRVSFCLFRGFAWSWQCGGQGPNHVTR
jgi:hypothetical protein